MVTAARWSWFRRSVWFLAWGVHGVAFADGVPKGAISFFDGASCPAGWGSYPALAGAAVVPVPAGAGVGRTGGGEVQTRPAHAHTYGGTLNPGSVSYIAIAGCCNERLGNADGHEVSGTSGKAVTGLPSMWLLACRKEAEHDPATPLPTGTVMFFEASCPATWTDYAPGHGRILVGTPAGGSNAAAFGGAPLADQENRTHRHAVTGRWKAIAQEIAAAGDGEATGYLATGEHTFGTDSSEAPSGVRYRQLLACRRDEGGR